VVAGRSSSRSFWQTRAHRIAVVAFAVARQHHLRTFGLTLFLAAVGLGSGAPFVQTFATRAALAADRNRHRHDGRGIGFPVAHWVFKFRTTISSVWSPA
jgi:hypothetical protein